MSIATTRLGILKPQGTDDNNVPLFFGPMADTLDDACIALRGTIASRPAAAIAGRIYEATDEGLIYLDTGTTWKTISGATGWTGFSYSGTWASAGSAGYKKTATDIILRGAVSKPTTPAGGETMFTLPAGFRPTAGAQFYVPVSAAGFVCKITVNTDGTVLYLAPPVDGGGNPGSLHLAGVRFPWA